MSGIVQNFLRRIEKIYSGRPTLPTPGTNHVDSTWNASDIYPGEFSLDLDRGLLQTSDSNSIILLNAAQSIESGLVLSKGNSGLNTVTISSGSAIINGRYYFHEWGGTAGTDLILPGNASTDYQIFFIYGAPTVAVYTGAGGTVGSYELGLNYVGMTGTASGSNGIVAKTLNGGVSIPDASVLLGAVLYPPSTVSTDLYPSAALIPNHGGVAAKSSPADYMQERMEKHYSYTVDKLYFEDQILVDIVNRKLYLAEKTFISSTPDIDESAGNIAPLDAGTLTILSLTASASVSTVRNQFFLVNSTAGIFTVTLPTAIGNSGLVYKFKKINTGNTVTIATTSSQTIDGSLTISIAAQYAIVNLISDGANWYIC